MHRGLILSAIFAGSLLVGCVTLTEKIEPSLLTEATADQNAQIQKLGQDAIAKRDERVIAEKAVAVSEAMLAVSKEQIKTYEQNGRLLDSQNSLYTIEGSKEKIDEVSKISSANSKKITQEKAHSDYLTIWSDQLRTVKELRELELESIFAQVNVIKASAAYEFQTKRQEKKPIDVGSYRTYADTVSKKITEKQAELKKAEEKTARAKDALVKTGYGA